MTGCPDCGHDVAAAGPSWVDRAEEWVRARLGTGPRARVVECRAGMSYDADGCGCTHPFHR